MIKLDLIFPCLEGHKDHIFYKADTNLIKNQCKKCEFVSLLGVFIDRHYQDYHLERCCDVGKRLPNMSESQPEAVFVNALNPNEKIVIEAKKQTQMYYSDIKEDIKEFSKRKRFENKIVYDIAKKTYSRAVEYLDKLEIKLPIEVNDLFLLGYELRISRAPEIEEFRGRRISVIRSVFDEIMSYKGKQEKAFIDKIVEENAKYIVRNIIGCIRNKEFNAMHEFTIDKLSFLISKINGKDFNVSYFEYPDGVRDIFNPDMKAIEERINKRFEECKLKFFDYMARDYKRILIVENENYYSRNEMLRIMSNIDVPQFIDELWSSFYIIEEGWNEDKEDYEDHITGIEFIRIYPQSEWEES